MNSTIIITFSYMNNIVITNDPETFADRVVELFKDDKLYKRISRNSRLLVEKKFSWEKGVDILEQVLERTISEWSLGE